MLRPAERQPVHETDYPLVQETLGLWRLTRGIGRGGMGEVYAAEYDFLHLLTLRYQPDERGMIRRELGALPRAEQSRLASEMLGTPLPEHAQFAIKVCSARSGTAGHRRFIQEAELAKRLGDHPYIVSVHAVHNGDGDSSGTSSETGRHRDIAYMVMDQAIREYEHTCLSITESIHLIRCMATALDHAHQHGVVHRDLKPENILGSIEHPYLTDFGIAKELDQSLGLTRTGQVIGTLDYMSPEQATDAKNVDRRSDVYSLGVVLYECATRGHLPYIHLAEREAALAGIRNERIEPKWPRDHTPDFPLGLQRIILKATAHRPSERYQEMSEFIRDLDRLSRNEWIAPIGRVHPRRWARHQAQTHPRLVWGLPAVLVLLLLLWVFWMLPTWFDKQRAVIVAEIKDYTQTVQLIEGQRRQQLSIEEQQRFHSDLRMLVLNNRDNYEDLAQQFFDLEQRNLRNRYLKADFSGPVDTRHSKLQLEAAAQIPSPNWSLREDGLHFNEARKLSLGPYGSGKITIRCRVTLPEPRGFQLAVEEAQDPRNLTRFEVVGGQLVLSLTQDERPPQVLYRTAIEPGDAIDCFFGIDANGIRAFVPDRLRPHQAVALGLDEAARVRLFMPEGAILHQLEIWPREVAD